MAAPSSVRSIGAAAAAHALRPSALHPAGIEQDRLHALHLGDAIVERSGRGIPGRQLLVVRVEPRVELGAVVGEVDHRMRITVAGLGE
jgi:hypothetical protein